MKRSQTPLSTPLQRVETKEAYREKASADSSLLFACLGLFWARAFSYSKSWLFAGFVTWCGQH